MAHVDVGSGDGALVLDQEGEVRSHRRQQRVDQPDADRQRDARHYETVFRASSGRGSATETSPGAGFPLWDLRRGQASAFALSAVNSSWVIAPLSSSDLAFSISLAAPPPSVATV